MAGAHIIRYDIARQSCAFFHADSELAVCAKSPGENFTVGTLANRVLMATGNFSDFLSDDFELLNEHERISLVCISEPKLAVTVLTTRVEHSIFGQSDCESHSAANICEFYTWLSNAHQTWRELVTEAFIRPLEDVSFPSNHVGILPLSSNSSGVSPH